MDIILDYKKDANNGISTISQFNQLSIGTYGIPAMTNKYLIVPIKSATSNEWRILSYKYDSDVDNWVSHQLLDDVWETAIPLRAALTVNTDLITNILSMGILNNETGECFIYRLDNFLRWYLFQTVIVPITLPNAYTLRFSMDEYHLVISDYRVGSGVVYVYLYDGNANKYLIETTLTGPSGSVRFGDSVCVRQTQLIVGDPYANTLVNRAGRVYIYLGFGPNWVVEMILTGDIVANAYFGQSLEAFIDVLNNNYRLIVGSPGHTNSRGKVYYYHRTMPGLWTFKNSVTEPSPYPADNNQFGSCVSIWDDQSAISAGNELLGQGAVYCYRYNGSSWVIDTLSTGATPARFTHAGKIGYGKYICITPQTVFTYILTENSYFLSRAALGWKEFTFIYANQLFIKNTTNQSFFHQATGNQTVTFILKTPIQGRYKVILDMENALQTVGSHNDTIYISFDGVFRSVKLDHGNYTGDQLADHLKLRLDLVFPLDIVFFVRWEAPTKKFTVITDVPFAWGSNDPTSFQNSGQNKLLGFYDNDYTIVHGIYGSDRQVNLTPPTRIGFKVVESIPVVPVRNNSVFSECGLIVDLDTTDNRFKITEEMNHSITIPYKTNTLTCTFPCIDGGGLMNINTNDIKLRLVHI